MKGHKLTSDKKLYVLYGLIAAVWVCQAWFSEGFYHPDEHFQIIEFAQWKLGLATEKSVPWELHECIRPALQPVLCAGLLQIFRIMGINSPFTLALLLRVFAGIVSATAIGYYIKANRRSMPRQSMGVLIAVSYLLWFLPAVDVRFSSEVMSGASLVFLTALLVSGQNQERGRVFFYGIGALGALAFELRYQTAFGLLGLFLWGVLVRKWRLRAVLELAGGFLGSVAACTALDMWFYGKAIFAPYNYFKVNILDGVAAGFGTSPWYWYGEKILVGPTILIGVMIAAALLFAFCRHWRHPSLWLLAAFLIGHSFVSHKELRFLFPVINFVPLLLVWSYESLKKRKRIAAYTLAAIFVGVNTIGLAMMVTKPANYGKGRMMRIVAERCASVTPPEAVYFGPDCAPFTVSSLEVSFYKPVNLPERSYYADVDAHVHADDTDLSGRGVVLTKDDFVRGRYMESRGLRRSATCMPDWIDWLNKFYNVYDPHWSMAYYED